MALDIRRTVRAWGLRDGIRRLRADDGIRTRDPHLGKVMLYQLSHVRMPVPSHPGPVRRIAPALRQNCIRSWPNHQLGTGGRAKNLSLERTLLTPSPPLPQVTWISPVADASRDAARLRSPPVVATRSRPAGPGTPASAAAARESCRLRRRPPLLVSLA